MAPMLHTCRPNAWQPPPAPVRAYDNAARQVDGGKGCGRLLSTFEPISLAEMKDVSLLDRVDTKYLMTVDQLDSVLAALVEYYRILDIDGVRLNHYRTLYYDTPDFLLYLHHHAGRRQRFKVRSRQYVDTELSFLEVKCRSGRNRTIKHRVQTPDVMTDFTPSANDFVHACAPFDPERLEPKLWNDFCRITLVSKHRRERVTLDQHLQFRRDGLATALPGLVVAEVKQDGVDHDSKFVRQMRVSGIRPISFSKYCIWVSLLYQNVKHNRLKPRLPSPGKSIWSENGQERKVAWDGQCFVPLYPPIQLMYVMAPVNTLMSLNHSNLRCR